MWDPHRSPMRMLVADSERCGRQAPVGREHTHASHHYISRMATLPTNCLNTGTHFRSVRFSTATDMQTVMSHAILEGSGSNEDSTCDELDTGCYEDEIESTLVIGHYEVDERRCIIHKLQSNVKRRTLLSATNLCTGNDMNECIAESLTVARVAGLLAGVAVRLSSSMGHDVTKCVLLRP